MLRQNNKSDIYIDQLADDLRRYLQNAIGDLPGLWAAYNREEFYQSSSLLIRKIIRHRIGYARDPALALGKAMRHCTLPIYRLPFPSTRPALFRLVGTWVSNNTVKIVLLRSLVKS